MQVPYLLIWFTDGDINACALERLPKAFVHENQTYYESSVYLGDVDYLRDDNGCLVGFAYTMPLEKDEIALYNSLLSQSETLKEEEGMLIVLMKAGSYQIECVQALDSRIYQSQMGKFMLAVPNSGFGNLCFDLKTDDLPWPE